MGSFMLLNRVTAISNAPANNLSRQHFDVDVLSFQHLVILTVLGDADELAVVIFVCRVAVPQIQDSLNDEFLSRQPTAFPESLADASIAECKEPKYLVVLSLGANDSASDVTSRGTHAHEPCAEPSCLALRITSSFFPFDSRDAEYRSTAAVVHILNSRRGWISLVVLHPRIHQCLCFRQACLVSSHVAPMHS